MSLSFSRRFPLYCLFASLLLGAVLTPWPDLVKAWVSGETGIIELGTVLCALWGSWTAVRIIIDRKHLPHPLFVAWFALFAVGLFFLAGEEASWGQSWFHWATPRDYAAMNMQGETNLHNLSSVTEQLPKTSLVLAALFGGVIWPIWAWAKKTGPYLGGGWFSWLWPSAMIWPAAALTIVMRVLERVLVATNFEDFIRPQYIGVRESIELYGVLFVLAYLWDVRRRMLSQNA